MIKLETEFTANIIKIGNSYGITIPKNDIEFLNLKEGILIKVKLIINEKEGDSYAA